VTTGTNPLFAYIARISHTFVAQSTAPAPRLLEFWTSPPRFRSCTLLRYPACFKVSAFTLVERSVFALRARFLVDSPDLIKSMSFCEFRSISSPDSRKSVIMAYNRRCSSDANWEHSRRLIPQPKSMDVPIGHTFELTGRTKWPP